jgi:nucleoside-diphosphate-sugar epimerase
MGGSMNILVLGGDGYLGSPTALHLSEGYFEPEAVVHFAEHHAPDYQ